MKVHLRRLSSILFPSWSFFVDEGGKPELLHRWIPAGEGGAPGEWLGTLPPARRSWTEMVFSPDESLRSAVQSLVERALEEDAESLGVSMELIRNAVRFYAAKSGSRAPAGAMLQFLVRMGAEGDGILSDPFGPAGEGEG